MARNPRLGRPPKDPKTTYSNLHLRLAEAEHKIVQAYATKEHRSVAQMLALMVAECIETRAAAAKAAGRRAA